MAHVDLAQVRQTQDGQRDEGAPYAPWSASPMVDGLLALQRSAGNRAVGDLLAHRAPAQPTVVQRDDKGGGDGSKKPATVQQVLDVGYVNGLLESIATVKTTRIEAWAETANLKEPAPEGVTSAILGAVLSLVTAYFTLGMSQIFTKSIGLDALKAHVVKKGGEAAGKYIETLGEKSFELVKSQILGAFARGETEAITFSEEHARTKLASSKKNIVGMYAEAMKLQVDKEKLGEQKHFQETGAASMLDPNFLSAHAAALELLHERLVGRPELYQFELTKGYMQLMDKSYIEQTTKGLGESPSMAFTLFPSLRDADERRGNLVLWTPHVLKSLMKSPGGPDLGFDFEVTAVGVNTETLTKLAGTAIKDLPFSLGFRFIVEDPFTPDHSPPVWAYFTRDSKGGVWLDRQNVAGLDLATEEWYAQYYLGKIEYDEKNRTKYAQQGVEKLYGAVKDKYLFKFKGSN